MTTPLQNIFATLIGDVEAVVPPNNIARTYAYAARETIDPRAETAHRRFTISLPAARRIVSQNDTGFVVEYDFELYLYLDLDGLIDFSSTVSFWLEAQQIADTINQRNTWADGTWHVIAGDVAHEYVDDDGEDNGRVKVTIPLSITVGESL